MAKIQTETRYNDTSFVLVRAIKNLRMFISRDDSICIIVDSNDEVLFEIEAYCAQNSGFLQEKK